MNKAAITGTSLILDTAPITPRPPHARVTPPPPLTSLAPFTPLARLVVIAGLALTALFTTGPARADGGTMPHLSGKGLVAAYHQLNYDTKVQLKDGRGASRHVLWPASWKVCDQHPKAGTPFSHQPITLTVVKTHESCAGDR
ncbi:hypothetical protein [Streptomyces lunalinharesii]|uniref:PASTA domain-containing protein n=1 Tax=Streptomyces lunalinharesii TaxID=333384 RepID=A0ABN3SLQ6_9ACTN